MAGSSPAMTFCRTSLLFDRVPCDDALSNEVGTLAELRAPLGGPGAGAGAGLPGALAGIGQKPAGACRPRLAVAHDHGDRAVGGNLAADIDRHVAAIGENAVGNAQGIAIARDAVALLGDDRHAPQAVIARHGIARRCSESEARSSERAGNQAGP